MPTETRYESEKRRERERESEKEKIIKSNEKTDFVQLGLLP
jgi:hypothetical protein